MSLPYFEVRRAEEGIRAELMTAVRHVIERGHYILGPDLEAFEHRFASYLGARHVIGVANGLEALMLLLRALGIGPGDEVIVPSHTYVGTWVAVTECGARPVPVEALPTTYNLDPERVEARIGPKTRAILVVHLYGQPADMDLLSEIARRHGLFLLEDAAQAHGARYKGRMAGTLADGAGFSFYPTKNLGALGDGGAVVTNEDAVADRVRLLRNYGTRTRYVSEVTGLNSRLDELQAACLLVKLSHLDAENARRRALAAHLLDALSDSGLGLPAVPSWADPAWHLFVVTTAHRAAFQRALAARGIGSSVHYPVPPHLQPSYRWLGYGPGAFPVTEQLADHIVSLPMAPYFTDEEVHHLCMALREAALATHASCEAKLPSGCSGRVQGARPGGAE